MATLHSLARTKLLSSHELRHGSTLLPHATALASSDVQTNLSGTEGVHDMLGTATAISVVRGSATCGHRPHHCQRQQLKGALIHWCWFSQHPISSNALDTSGIHPTQGGRVKHQPQRLLRVRVPRCLRSCKGRRVGSAEPVGRVVSETPTSTAGWGRGDWRPRTLGEHRRSTPVRVPLRVGACCPRGFCPPAGCFGFDASVPRPCPCFCRGPPTERGCSRPRPR